MKSSRGFTLIELLIVIAIIGILMALLFPAIQSALDAAKKAQAKNDVTQLATAVIAYEVEYGKLPGSNSATPDDLGGDALSALMGSNVNNSNPRQIVFFEAKTAKNKKGGYDSGTGKYYDPWGGVYRVLYDSDYDTALTNNDANSITSSSIRKKVAIWNTNSVTRKRVASWE